MGEKAVSGQEMEPGGRAGGHGPGQWDNRRSFLLCFWEIGLHRALPLSVRIILSGRGGRRYGSGAAGLCD